MKTNIFLIFFVICSLSCSSKPYSTDLVKIDVNLNQLRNYFVFDNNIVFRKNIDRLRRHDDTLITNTLFSIDVNTNKIDSVKFNAPYYLTIEGKLNDSLFAVAFYDKPSFLKIRDLGIDRDYSRDFKDTLLEIKEIVLIFSNKLKLIDSTVIVHKISTNLFNNIFAPFIDDIEFKVIIPKIFLNNEFPVFANSFEEFSNKYKTILKYNKFWCRNIEIEREIVDNQTIRNDTFSYWQIFFSTKETNLNNRLHPHFQEKNSIQDYIKYKEFNKYYYGNQLFYSDTLNLATDYMLMGVDNKLLIASKSLPDISNNLKLDSALEKFYLNIVKLENPNFKLLSIDLGNKIPTSFFYNNEFSVFLSAANRDSLIKKAISEKKEFGLEWFFFKPFLEDRHFLELNLETAKIKELDFVPLTANYRFQVNKEKVYLNYKNVAILEWNSTCRNLILGENYIVVQKSLGFDKMGNELLSYYYKKI